MSKPEDKIGLSGPNTTPNHQEIFLDITLFNGPPWGFAIGGGSEFRRNLVVDKITAKGVAAESGKLKETDELVAINGVHCVSRSDAIRVIKDSGDQLTLKIRRKIPLGNSKVILANHGRQRQSFYETVYEEMIENIDTLSTSYSDRKNFMKNSGGSLRLPSSNHDSKPAMRRESDKSQQGKGDDSFQMAANISPSEKERGPPSPFIIADNKEVKLNIDLNKGQIWTQPDQNQIHATGDTLEAEASHRNTSSPVGVQKVRVKSVNVTALHPKVRESHAGSQMQNRSGTADTRHTKSQDGPPKGYSLPRSSASMDNMAIIAGTGDGRTRQQASSLGDDDRRRKLSVDNIIEDSGVENTSNMNVRKAKEMFEEISRSTENLLEIGRTAPSSNRPRPTPRQDMDKKELIYNETNNNYTKRGPDPVEYPGYHLQTDLDSGQTIEAKALLANRFPSIMPQHGHTRSLPAEYEDTNEAVTSKVSSGRGKEGARRPRSAHYLLENNQQRVDARPMRRIPVEQVNNQAQLMRSFRVSRSQFRTQGAEFSNTFDGDEENELGGGFRRQAATRRSVEDLRYLPNASMQTNSGLSEGITRAATLPATEMREAAKKYQEQLFKQHPSSYRYSFGHTVDPPKLKRSSSFGSQSQSRSESVSSIDQPILNHDESLVTVQESSTSDSALRPSPKSSSVVSDSHLSQACAREDSGNSILSRLLREHNATNTGGNLAKIEEEAHRKHGPRLSAGGKSMAFEENTCLGDLPNHVKEREEKQLLIPQFSDCHTREVESSVKTVAVSSSTMPFTSTGPGHGQRGFEYVQGIRKPSLSDQEGEARSKEGVVDKSRPRLDDFVGSALRSQVSGGDRVVIPVTVQSTKSEPVILHFDRSPKAERNDGSLYQASRLSGDSSHFGRTHYGEQDERPVVIAHDKEPSTDSVKELSEIEESARQTPQKGEGAFDSQPPDLEALPPPPDELLAESPPEREKPQRTINRKKRDNQQLQSSSRNSSCVSTDSTTSTATADSGIGMRPCRSTDSSPRTSPLAENHSGYDYDGGKDGQTFKGSQEISDEDEGITSELPHATSTPDRTDTSFTELKVESSQESDHAVSPAMIDTPGSSPRNSPPGSASFLGPRFEELDTEKSKLIQSMRDKIQELKHEESEITDEIKANEVLGSRVRSMIEARANQTEFSKYELFIGELNNIVALLLSLTQRLHRYELMLQDLDMSEEEDKQKRDELIHKIDKLKSQHEEACHLREVNDKRGEYVSTFLEKYCTEEEHADFQYYVDMKSQLALMQSEIKEKVKLAEERLKALESTALEWSS